MSERKIMNVIEFMKDPNKFINDLSIALNPNDSHTIIDLLKGLLFHNNNVLYTDKEYNKLSIYLRTSPTAMNGFKYILRDCIES